MPRRAAALPPPMTIGKILHYPPRALVLVAGLPGAGKSTLLLRLYGMRGDESLPVVAEGVRVIDSRQARNWWDPRLRLLPPRARIPFVYCTHVWRIVRAVLAGHTVIAHTRGTWPHLLYGFSWLTRSRGAEMHLILLNVTAEEALAGQRARGRVLTPAVFARHCRRWETLMTQVERGTLAPRTAGVTVLDRTAADRLEEIHITAPPP